MLLWALRHFVSQDKTMIRRLLATVLLAALTTFAGRASSPVGHVSDFGADVHPVIRAGFHAPAKAVRYGVTTAATQTNPVPDWCSYTQTGNVACIQTATNVAAAIGQRVYATNGYSSAQTLATPTINGALQVANEDTLSTLPAASFATVTTVSRAGYSTPGDGGAATYTLSSSACTLNSGAGDGGAQVPAAGGKCWIATFPNNEASAKVWGAKFNSTDDSASLQAALNWAVSSSGSLVLPCGYGYFSTPLKAGNGTNWTLRGADNGTCSALVYSGSSTTVDLLTIGEVGSSGDSYGVTITGFRIDSNTQMTAGDALHLWHLKQSRVDPTMSGQSGNGQFWNGIHYDEVDIVRTPNAYIYGAANDNVLANGSKQSESWYPNYVGEVRLGQGKIAPSDPQLSRGGSGQYSQTGIHVAGSVGGFSVDAVDIIANHHDVLVDNSQTGVQNQTVLLGPGTFTDSSIGDNIVLNDTGSTAVPGFGGTKRFFDYGWNACAGCASGTGNGITIQNFTDGAVVLAGYAIQGNQGHGIYDEDASAYVSISSSEVFNNNTDVNIASSVKSPKISSNNPTIMSGTAYEPNALTSTLPMYGGPFAFSPAVNFGGSNAGVQTATTVGNYTLDGRNVRCEFNLTLTSAGTATGDATITGLPMGQDASIGATGGGGELSYASGFSGLTGAMALSMDSGGSNFANIYQWGSGGMSPVTNSNFSSTSALRGSVTFIRQ